MQLDDILLDLINKGTPNRGNVGTDISSDLRTVAPKGQIKAYATTVVKQFFLAW